MVDTGSILESCLHTGKIAARQIVAKEGRKPALLEAGCWRLYLLQAIVVLYLIIIVRV